MDSPGSRKTTPAAESGSPDAGVAAMLCPAGLVLTSGRRVLWCNPAFAQMFGYAESELMGESLRLLYPTQADFERVGLRGLEAMIRAGTYADERLMRHKEGTLHWYRARGRAMDPADPFKLAAWLFEPIGAGLAPAALTPREREVLGDLMRGLSAKESGRALGISPRTVEKYRLQLRERFGVHTSAALMSRVAGFPMGS